MFRIQRLLLLLLLPTVIASANSPLTGHWRMDPARSAALDGWTAWDLILSIDGSSVSLRHDMTWRSTKHSATNSVDTAQAIRVPDFFRVEQRHMALYPAKAGTTAIQAKWLDQGRTLRVEAETPIEISQGEAIMRLYYEYRLIEGDDGLLLIELHSTRPQPLVYRFNRVKEEK